MIRADHQARDFYDDLIAIARIEATFVPAVRNRAPVAGDFSRLLRFIPALKR